MVAGQGVMLKRRVCATACAVLHVSVCAMARKKDSDELARLKVDIDPATGDVSWEAAFQRTCRGS